MQGTPFFLVHGVEAVLPVKIIHEAPRVEEYEEVESTKALEDDVNAFDKAHDVALARATTSQQNMHDYHSHRLRPRSFEVRIWSFESSNVDIANSTHHVSGPSSSQK
jgi:hypothetical protein